MNTSESAALCLTDNRLNSSRIAVHILFHFVEHADLVLLLQNVKSSCVDRRFQLVRLFLTVVYPQTVTRNCVHNLSCGVVELVKLRLTGVSLVLKLCNVAVPCGKNALDIADSAAYFLDRRICGGFFYSLFAHLFGESCYLL